MSGNFYDDAYWRGNGRLLWNLRRVTNLILVITEMFPGMQAPYLLPVMHQYKRHAWLGWEASWFTPTGAYLQLRLIADRLMIETGVDNDGEGFEPQHQFAYSNQPPAGSNTVYEPYSQAGLTRGIAFAQAWLGENLGQLQTIDYSLNRLFFNTPAGTVSEQAMDDAWYDKIGNPELACIRKLVCLCQAVHLPGRESGFIAHMGYSAADHDLQKLHSIQAEWFIDSTGDASFEFYADGSLLWDTYAAAPGGEMVHGLDFVYDPAGDHTHERELTSEKLTAAITAHRAWLADRGAQDAARIRLYGDFGLEQQPTGNWVNTLPVASMT